MATFNRDIKRKFVSQATFLANTIRGQAGFDSTLGLIMLHNETDDTEVGPWSKDSLQCLLAGTQTLSGPKTFSTITKMNMDAGSIPTLDSDTALAISNTSAAGDNVYSSLISGATGKAGIYFGDTAFENSASIIQDNNTEVLLITAGTRIDFELPDTGNPIVEIHYDKLVVLGEISSSTGNSITCGGVLMASQNFELTGTMLCNSTTESTSTLTGSIQTDGGMGVVKNLFVGSDLTVDTTTFHVDSANNRVGVGTITPSETFHVEAGRIRLDLDSDEIPDLSTYSGTINDDVGMIITNQDAGSTYCGISLRTRETAQSAWNIYNKWTGSNVGDLIFVGRTGSTMTASLTLTPGGAATFTGPIIAPATTTSIPSIRLPHGTAPSSPTNGDIWTTTSGLFARINGSTVGPFTA